MAEGKTIFFTYILGDKSVTGGTGQKYQASKGYGYTPAIHCNYITKLETETLGDRTIDFVVPSGDFFPFLKSSAEIQTNQGGFGWNANRLFGVQVVDGISDTGATGTTIVADPTKWKIIDLTDQILGYETFSGTTIPKTAFNTTTFLKITNNAIASAPFYNLNYLDYPTSFSIDDDKLAFGEEAFFFGNITGEIKAIAYTTDISIVLPLNQYNSTTNTSWDAESPVVISEAGIFNNNNDLVAIGKLNNPISKDSTIFRTIEFSLDF
jgi:hypothetical protein